MILFVSTTTFPGSFLFLTTDIHPFQRSELPAMADITPNLESAGDVAPIVAEPSSSGGNSEPCCRRILSAADIDFWIHSEGYRDYLNFIRQLNDFAKRVHGTALKSRAEVVQPSLVKVVALLDRLSELVDQIVPFNDDKNQR